MRIRIYGTNIICDSSIWHHKTYRYNCSLAILTVSTFMDNYDNLYLSLICITLIYIRSLYLLFCYCLFINIIGYRKIKNKFIGIIIIGKRFIHDQLRRIRHIIC